MATLRRYPRGGAETIRGNIDYVNDDIVLIPTRSTFAFNAAHEFISDLTGTDIFDAARTSLTSNAISDAGAFTADAVTYTAPSSGNAITGFLIAVDSGLDSTSVLICWYNHEATMHPNNGASQEIAWAGSILALPTQSGDTRSYGRWLAECCRGNLDLSAADIRVQFVESAYTYSQAHDALDDLTDTVGTAQALDNEAVSDTGVLSSDAEVFSAFSGNAVAAAITYFHTGTPGTSWLIGRHANAEVAFTPNGEDLTITASSGWLLQTTGA